jgi:hypothetical protein
MIRARVSIFALFAALAAAGCAHGQAPVTPAPTATVTDTAQTCPSGYTCGYIVSRATCTSATGCPTPASSGPYTPLQTTANALATPSYTDPAPPPGVYVAYTFQFVYLTGPGLTGPETGAPSAASTAQLISLYPPTPGTPAVTTTAELAPELLPDAPRPQQVAESVIPRMGAPKVEIHWR